MNGEQVPSATSPVVLSAAKYLEEMSSELEELSLEDLIKALDLILTENQEFYIKYEGFVQSWRAKYASFITHKS